MELHCVSNSVVEEYGQHVYPMDQERKRSALVWQDLQLEDPVLKHLVPLVESGVKPEMSIIT